MTNNINKNSLSSNDSQTTLIKQLLSELGYHCDTTPNLAKTPERIAKHLAEATSSQNISLNTALSDSIIPAEGYDGVISLDNIFFTALCEHHLTPMTGNAVIFYKPAAHIVGIGSICNLVTIASKKLQLQERMTKEIADAIEQELQPQGLCVILTTQQHCITTRGPKQFNAKMRTIIRRGCFMKDENMTQYLLDLQNV